MIKRFLLSLIIILGFIAAPALAEKGISVKSPYAYATAATQKNGAVFMVIENAGETDDKVLSASSSIAERVELHTHTMDGGIMMMREVEHYKVSAGEDTILEPMGHHIMLMGLTHALSVGEHFPLVLDLEKAGPISIDVTVVKPGEAP